MALVLNERVKETTTTTGTGALSLGGASDGFETFAAGIGNSNTTYYAIFHSTADEFEVGLGTLDGDSSDLTRTTIYASSNSDSAVNFSAGTKTVFCTMPAARSVFLDADGDVTLGANLDVGGNLTVTGTTTFNGGTLTLGNADTDNIVFGGEVDSDIIPDDDGTYDLGSASKEWQDLFIDGTANIDALVADTADINGGTIDGAVIGGASAAAITGTAITGTSFVIGSANIAEAELEQIDGVTAGTVAASKAVVVDANKDIGSFRNITLTGELDAATLDVSGDADIDGTLEADAITVAGVALATFVRDTVGTNMVSSNTETGITVTYDTSNDNLDFAINAAQTTITSLLATDIKIGEDDQTKIDFETADEIHFYAANVEQVYLGDNIFGPQSDSDVDLGSTGVRWKDAFIDTVTTTGDLTVGGNFTVNGTTTTVATTNMVVADNLIELNNGAGSNSNDSGIVIERGSTGDNAIFMWDESADTFVLGTTTATGASTGNLSVTDGALQAGSLDISGNIDVDGTTNLDAVDIDGAVQIDAAVTVGVDDTGYDFKLFGATSGAHIIWDASDDALETVGGATINIVKDKLKIAGTAVTTTAAELNKLDGVTATTAELNYVAGVTSAIQTQLDTKTTPGFAVAMAIAL
jgi:cytoskeletal protein CcmA (bactofilin family)